MLERYTGDGEEGRHDGGVAVDRTDTRWCSEGSEIGCENGERVRIAFTFGLLRLRDDRLDGDDRR